MSNVALCNLSFIQIEFGNNLLTELADVKSFGQYKTIGRNKLEFSLKKPKMKNAALEGSKKRFHLSCGVEEESCDQMFNFGIEPENEYKALLDTRLDTETSAIYPIDTVRFVMSVAQNQDSKLECKSAKHIVYHNLWMMKVTVSSSDDQVPLKITHSSGLTEVLTLPMHFGEKWYLMVDVEFVERFTFSNGDHTSTMTVKTDVMCLVYNHIPGVTNALYHVTTKVLLHSSRGESVIIPDVV
ncbi:unnamed protein product [Echinostoma caproni]|uniref:DUF667 domain-containing protein n=1 Tax=Echinostoma caproni TaxID=27848 RepID=A0A183BCJ2_9TREM|nr:unnamed protein product [Echinostoma caproni]